MKFSPLVFLIFVGCSESKPEASLNYSSRTLLLPASFDWGNSVLSGFVDWHVRAVDGAASDTLEMAVNPHFSQSTISLNVDVPLNMIGTWENDELPVEYEYYKYADATGYGVGEEFVGQLRDFHQSTANPTSDPIPAADVDDSNPVARSQAGLGPDFANEHNRYLVRAVVLKIGADGSIRGRITLHPDPGDLPAVFDTSYDRELRVEGHLRHLLCDDLVSVAVNADTGVKTLKPSGSWSSLCEARFHP